MRQLKLLNEGIEVLLNEMIERLKPEISDIADRRIWGVPRGGVPVAYLLAPKVKGRIVNNMEEANIIVDDIICSGKTFEKVHADLDKKIVIDDRRILFDALIPEPEEETWYIFPWEGDSFGSVEDIPRRMLEYIGEDLGREGLVDTPKRVIKAWDHIFQGYKTDVESLFTTFSNEEKFNQMVILKDIEFYSMCEHHILPFYGKVHIAYLPNHKIVGVSKLARVVDAFSQRVQIQERMTEQIAAAIQDNLQPRGVAVYVEAQHFCMLSRGVQKQNSIMMTSALKGSFLEDESRIEFLVLSKR